jgi:hypothetical protein
VEAVIEMIVWLRQQLDTDERAAREVEGLRKPWYFDMIEDEAHAFIDIALSTERVLRQVQAHRAILDALEAARARSSAEWQNYGRWLENQADLPVPDGPPADAIPGLELAVKTLLSIYSDRDGWREGWSA